MAKKYTTLRLFDNQEELEPNAPQILGGKGYSLALMTQKGLPVPYGFTITTESWQETVLNEAISPNNWKEIQNALSAVEQKTGKKLGNPGNPLTYSLRSGARYSMPGLMDTILNMGLDDETLPGLAKQIGERAANDAYQKLIRNFGASVYGIDHHIFAEAEERFRKKYDGTPDSKDYFEQLVQIYKELIKLESGQEFEQDLTEQLRRGIVAICNSFNNHGAIEYRNSAGIPHDIGTAVNFVEMVYGNSEFGKGTSGTAVAFSRDIHTGEKAVTGHFMTNAQGDSVVLGYSNPLPLDELPPDILVKVQEHTRILEELYNYPVDIEVTWQGEDKLCVLQSRKAKLSPVAAIQCTIDLVKESRVTEEESFHLISHDQIAAVLTPRFDDSAVVEAREEGRLITKGMPLCTGVGYGKLVTDPEEAKKLVAKGENVIVLCDHFDPNDVALIMGTRDHGEKPHAARGIVTTTGSPSSHMGLVMSKAGRAGIMGCTALSIDQDTKTVNSPIGELKTGEIISIDSHTGEIFRGELALEEKPELSDEIAEFISKWEAIWGKNNPWAGFLFDSGQPLDDYLKHCQNETAAVSKKWKSAKAQQSQILCKVLPEEITIHAHAVKPEDTDKIRDLIKQATDQGHSIWFRSAYTPELLLAPYGSVDVTTADPKIVEEWIFGEESEVSKWGSRKQWMEITDEEGVKHKLEAILVPFEPKDKMNKKYVDEHFVGTVRCLSATTPQLIIDIRDQTYHLRSMKEANPDDLMQVIALSNAETPNRLGQVSLVFGRNHIDPQKISELIDSIKKDQASPRLRAILRKINRVVESKSFLDISEEFLTNSVLVLMENGLLGPKDLELIIQERSLAVLLYARDTIIGDWWNKHHLPHLMWALNQVTGASVLEIQGRITEDKPQWLLVYGTKGEEEAAVIEKANGVG